jgi:TPR repeat protein
MFRLTKRFRDWVDSPTAEFRSEVNRRREYVQAESSTDWECEANVDALRAAHADHVAGVDGALERLVDLAEEGSPIAATMVGEAYRWGHGDDIDPVEAEIWLRKAYELGSRRGLLSYGTMVYSRKDWAAAEKIFRTGVLANWPEAKAWHVAAIAKQQPGERVPIDLLPELEAAAAAGHLWANERLGWEMARGRFGLSKVPKGLRIAWRYVREVRALWRAREDTCEVRRPEDTVH